MPKQNLNFFRAKFKRKLKQRTKKTNQFWLCKEMKWTLEQLGRLETLGRFDNCLSLSFSSKEIFLLAVKGKKCNSMQNGKIPEVLRGISFGISVSTVCGGRREKRRWYTG